MIQTVLEKAGCACTVCANGAEAMDAIARGAPDLVVADIVMPERNGYEIFAAARQRDPEVPVVLITGFGYDPNHVLVRASAEGLRSVLYKPFTPRQLLAELCRAFDGTGPASERFLQPTRERAGVSALLPPLSPCNILCIGRNYPPAGESATAPPDDTDLEVFLKPTTAVQASGEPIRLPHLDPGSGDVSLDGEGELALIIGVAAKDVSEARALDHVLGYTIANDVTARRWQTPQGPSSWMRGKGFDTFCPLGPTLVTADELPDPGRLCVVTTINGTVVRRGETRTMLRPVPRIISELSRRLTLEPGTLILTGGPPRLPGAPAGPLRGGDEIAVEIAGIGRLVNRVVESAAERSA
jgi:2-keto-4-pentenoate hydratase/2-oxohepta-3-ene-1,7-dioic acid hydratase in catechol pathway